jgi:hypothetical protein
MHGILILHVDHLAVPTSDVLNPVTRLVAIRILVQRSISLK